MGRFMSADSSVEVPLFTSAASLAPTDSSARPATSRTSSPGWSPSAGRRASSESVAATGMTNWTSGWSLRMRSAASSMGGRIRAISLRRLPGRRATVVRPGGRPRAAR